MNRHLQPGFTLIEMAVVLVIIGFLLGSFITTFSERIDTTRINETEKELQEIKAALKAYAYSRGGVPYLPCPDTDVPPDGLENRVGGNCTAFLAPGLLPWRDLGLGFGDSWDTLYGYWVNLEYARDTGFTLATSNNANSASIRTRVNDIPVNIASNAVAVIFSHGKNSLGGVSIEGINRPALPAIGNGYDDENENADNDAIFMARYLTDEGVATAGGIFDDIVVWINAYELKAEMVEAGALP
jgi:prepilin-type N-terminal cleavage/methylation domain-containing protein